MLFINMTMKIKNVCINFLVVLMVLFFGVNIKANCTEAAKGNKNLYKEPITIGFLPLDTRPCTYDFPFELANIFGAKILRPDSSVMIDFREEPNLSAVREWFLEVAENCNVLVVSAEQLVYGGLIQAREADVGAKECEKALYILRSIKHKYPNMPIYLSSVLMRTSTTAFDEASLVWWKKIQDYSRAYYLAVVNGDNEAENELARLSEEIPAEVLNKFLRARELNYELNRSCIQLVKDGVVERLLIRQDDASGEGIQKFEQEKLMAEISRSNVSDRIFMANGTDEAGAELVMCALCPSGCDTEVVWLSDNIYFCARYGPFAENLKVHMASMNIRDAKGAENVLCILPPKQKQGNYCSCDFTDYEAYSDLEFEDIATRIYNFAQSGKHVFLLDLDCLNGGNSTLLKELAKKMSVTDLYGYSGWNTACNSLGMLLAQMLACGEENTAGNKRFTAERILDDCVYQSVVRRQACCTLKDLGENIWDLGDKTRAEEVLEKSFNDSELNDIFGEEIPKFQAKLRWPRLFEIRIILPEDEFVS